jgi:hypothetical protein
MPETDAGARVEKAVSEEERYQVLSADVRTAALK